MTLPPEETESHGEIDLPVATCYRHPDRETGLRCSRCDRPACPACLRDASVGQQCVECVREGSKTVPTPVTAAGARADVRGGRRPVVVPILILINVAVFAITAVQARSVMSNTQSPLFDAWVLAPGYTAISGQWWQLLTTGFLHIGPLHLLVNMFSLWIIGRDLELILGKARFVAIYLLSLVGGSMAVFLFGSIDQAVAGASTALYGLMGCILIAVIRLKLDPRAAIAMIVLNVIISVSLPGISLLGHLGGLVTGVLAMLGMVYAPARLPKANRTHWQIGVLAVLAVALVVLFVVRDQQLLALGLD